ncbi:ribonuclease H family protein [Clostridium fallax]|uniref:Ribonuclease HI n=1 Tax=Clostridium fallax TaxID=1533 RepID=A0A1M4Y8S2_9CLOT|nr:ribonuclease H family protein [Clostridium fallax]SHF02145.1 ribonuclease HI [Clostridium fallax]SQB06027.1 putative double-stranded RNA/RNA-DNA hybrid binding protein [Clostridium fallax]
MGKKVYAIKEGFDFNTNEKIENKIVSTWSECLKYVKGVKGAKYKSFEDINKAKEFLAEGSKMLKKGVDEYPKDCLNIYVDGSYNIKTKKYAYGLVAVRNDVIEYIDSGASEDTSQSNIRQIAGELEAAIKGVQYALSKKEKKVLIFHDYEGIAHHATGFWERREESSIKYYNKMNELIKLGIEVIFVKVDSHTGELFNELADEKCKEKLFIDSDKVVDKWLNNNVLYVTDDKIKKEILEITNNKEDKIIIVNQIDKNKNNKIEEKIDLDISKKINEMVKSLSKEKQLKVLDFIKNITLE